MKSISSAVPSAQLRRQYVADLDCKPETLPRIMAGPTPVDAREVEMAEKLPAELFTDVNEVFRASIRGLGIRMS